MTLSELISVLGPVTDLASHSPDHDVVLASVVLCALLGALENAEARTAFDSLTVHAGLICAFRGDPPRLRLRYRRVVGHVHCRLFSPNGAKHGDLVFDTAEWPRVRALFELFLEVLPDDV
jgi:hypothetical protein